MPGNDSPVLTIHLFGPFEVLVEGVPLSALRSRKGQWLLALLTIRAGRAVERGWLAGTLWPESPEDRALARLRTSLSEMRSLLGPAAACIETPTARTLRLDPSRVMADLIAFEAAIERGDALSLEAAVSLYRGPLLEGCVEEWAFQERRTRELAYLSALETLAAHALAAGDPRRAEDHLERVVAIDPLRESAVRALMQLAAEGGNFAGASEIYRELRERLHREANLEPDPETTALFQHLRADVRKRAAAGPGTIRSFSPPPASGLPRSQELEGNPRLPAPGSSRSASCPEGGAEPVERRTPPLPLPLTRFIGRERQLVEVKDLLANHRLLTLTGAGGCGKTRLALQVADELPETLADGVRWVGLGPLADPELVPRAVAGALGLRDQAGRSLPQVLADFLQPWELLLLLDNCEHVATACAQLAETLLQACPHLRILATSREPLGVAGERPYRVPSLSVPVHDRWHPLTNPVSNALFAAFVRSEAVQFFVERATTAQPSFQLTPENLPAVATICRQLDGIPLAIELAAARMTALPAQTIAEHLEDRFRLLVSGSRTAPPRHQTLRALIDWSYDQLPAGERTLLCRLSIFAGGWDLEAATAVCPDDATDQLAVLDLLAALVEKSLVQYEPRGGRARYRLLETIRAYARERLREVGEEERVCRAHAEFFLRLAEDADPKLRGPEQVGWVDRLEAEHDNLRAALDWCAAEASGAAIGLRLAGALGWFWFLRGYAREGHQRLEKALTQTRGQERGAADARALCASGHLLQLLGGDLTVARSRVEEGLSIYRRLGEARSELSALAGLAALMGNQGELDAASGLHEECIQLARELEDGWQLAVAFRDQAATLWRRGEYEAVVASCEEALRLFREAGDRGGMATSFYLLAAAARRRGDQEQASILLREGLALAWELEMTRETALCLEMLADIDGEQPERAWRAARLLGAVSSLVDATDPSRRGAWLRDGPGARGALAVLGEEAFERAWTDGCSIPLEQAVSEALTR